MPPPTLFRVKSKHLKWPTTILNKDCLKATISSHILDYLDYLYVSLYPALMQAKTSPITLNISHPSLLAALQPSISLQLLMQPETYLRIQQLFQQIIINEMRLLPAIQIKSPTMTNPDNLCISCLTATVQGTSSHGHVFSSFLQTQHETLYKIQLLLPRIPDTLTQDDPGYNPSLKR